MAVVADAFQLNMYFAQWKNKLLTFVVFIFGEYLFFTGYIDHWKTMVTPMHSHKLFCGV